ncbi:MAG: hypothetical protein SGI90_12375 [Candidatus Eisenbacteria bacterium]|nr:hypothetical protein [Candidatus Eisenbacteria bacterium]
MASERTREIKRRRKRREERIKLRQKESIAKGKKGAVRAAR